MWLNDIKEFAAIGLDKQPKQHCLYNWVFHFNAHTQLWNAIPRDLQTEYWSDSSLSGVLKSKHLNTLLDLLQRFDGDAEAIKEIKPGIRTILFKNSKND